MQSDLGVVALDIAIGSLVIVTLAGVWRQRGRWARVAAMLLGGSLLAFCVAVRRLVSLPDDSDARLWTEVALAMGVPMVLSSHLFALCLGRADPGPVVRRRRSSLLAQAVVGAGFLALVDVPAFLQEYLWYSGGREIRLGALGQLYCGYLLVGIGLTAFRIEETCRGARGPLRERLMWVAVGAYGLAGYFTYLLTEGVIGGVLDMGALVASAVPIALCSLLAGFVHLRGPVPDSPVLEGRQPIYRSLTGFMALGYLIIVLLADSLADRAGFRPGTFAAGAFFFAVALLLGGFVFSRPLRRRIRRLIDRYFFPERFDYRTYWLRASHELVSGVGLSDLLERGTMLIEDLFGSKPVTIHLSRRPGDAFRLMSSTASPEPPDVEPGEPVARCLEDAVLPCLVQPEAERRGHDADPNLLPVYVENEMFLQMTRARVVAPLRTDDRLIGFVTLGPGAGKSEYNHEDLALLETVTLQLASAIRGAWLAEDLGVARELEVFSQLANVVVHDLKNFVSPLKLFVQNARRHMHNPDFREQAIGDIQSVVERMDRAIHRLTTIRHGEEMSPVPTDLHWVLDSALARSGLEDRPGFRVDRRYGRLPAVVADPLLLDRVVDNLLTNAIEAMPDGGALTVETLDQRDPITGNRWAVVLVRDTGVGMEPGFLRHRLFQPFATTRKRGWGMGLYQCRSIIEGHGGTLTATSRPGEGSEFRFCLPVKVTAPAGSLAVGPGRPGAPGMPGRRS